MIWQYLGVGVIAFMVVVLQSTLFPFIGDVLYVDLLLVIVVIIGLFKDPVHGAAMSFGVGYIQDLFSPEVSGFFMTARLSVFFAAQGLRGRFSPETPFSQCALGLGLGILDRVIVLILHHVFTEPLFFSAREFLFVMLGTLINAALVPIFYFGFRLIPGFIEMPRGPSVVE